MSTSGKVGGDALEHARSQLGEALSELRAAGAIEETIMEARPAWFLPFRIVVGQSRTSPGDANFIWVIGGKVPIDCIPSNVAQRGWSEKKRRISSRLPNTCIQSSITTTTGTSKKRGRRIAAPEF
jgi:hypothetical protein